MSIKDAVKWFQEHLGFINRLPSWLNELLSGFLVVGVAFGLLILFSWLLHFISVIVDLRVWTFPFAFILNEVYEHLFDPYGYNPQDVVERMRGIVIIMLAHTIIRYY